MATAVRSFAKINLGLRIGSARPDGFHELRTLYQTIALHDVVKVEVQRGAGIAIRCPDPRVPTGENNTCHRVAERVLTLLRRRGRVVIEIDKRLPVQGGLGAASSNGVATLLALERELKRKIPAEEKLRIAAEVGSDLPLFLVGGAVLGVGHGEEVFPVLDLPPLPLVVVTPAVSVSTPAAFAAWDQGREGARQLTPAGDSDNMNSFSRSIFGWWCGTQTSGVPRGRSKDRGDRAETLLLDLVRAGIENDFERVVFPRYPELRDVKRVLEGAGARYASLSGSGSALYGLFATRAAAQRAAAALVKAGIPAQATTTLPRRQYWQQMWK